MGYGDITLTNLATLGTSETTPRAYENLSPQEGPRYHRSSEYRYKGHVYPSFPLMLPPKSVPTTLWPPDLPLMPASQVPGSRRASGPRIICFIFGWRKGEAFSFLIVERKNIAPTPHRHCLKERLIKCLL